MKIVKKRYLFFILESFWKVEGISEVTPKEYLIIKGLKNPIVNDAIICAPPDCDKKSIQKPRIKDKKISKV
jgi:hypothetical protein|tara:strand:+ start:608 stop:820 length:213 start_codon:yes stop_codon:yes gene_type:complete